MPPLSLDADQFRQVLVNLLQNAVEAGARGRRGKVLARIRVEAGAIVLDVKDDGVGIPPQNLDQIFEPLFTTRARGTGLGLAIVATIVKRHGASIDVGSKLGEGTTFTVRVPIDAS